MPQFFDTFPGSTLNTTNWADGSISPATSTVASGQLTLAGNGGGNAGTVKTVSSYSLDLAGANGLQISVQSATSNCYAAFVDSANHGYAFHFIAGPLQETGSWNEPPSFTSDGNGTSVAIPVILRFAINGANVEMAYSTDGGGSWTVQKTTAKSAFVTTAVYVRLYCGTGDTFVINDVTIDGGASPIVFEEDAFIPGVVPPGRQQVPWLATVFS